MIVGLDLVQTKSEVCFLRTSIFYKRVNPHK